MLLADAPLGTIGGSGLGPFGNQNLSDPTVGATNVVNTISSIIGLMTVAAAIWFILQIIFGGYEWMSAGGDTKKIENARSRVRRHHVVRFRGRPPAGKIQEDF